MSEGREFPDDDHDPDERDAVGYRPECERFPPFIEDETEPQLRLFDSGT